MPLERVWIIHEDLYGQRNQLPPNRHAEVLLARDFSHFSDLCSKEDRLVLLADLPTIKKVKSTYSKLVASQILPKELNQEKLLFTLRSVLQDARLQHDLEAAETITMGSMGSVSFDDPSIELIGSCILELSAARNMESIEEAVRTAISRYALSEQVKIVAYPETINAVEMDHFHLVVPIHFQGALKAHVYLRFVENPDRTVLQKVSDAIFNLSDGISLAVERNQMIAKAEETKTVWEASFDAVEDPVAILDENYLIVRGNRAFSKVSKMPLVKLSGQIPTVIKVEELKEKAKDQTSEWGMQIGDNYYRAYLDPIQAPLGSGRYVLRFHNISEERNLTEKILAKEQIAELGILVGSVAHEINNPIGGILAIGQILKKDLSKDSPFYEDIQNIVQAADRCAKIVRTMLSLVRKSEEEKKPIPIEECIQGALDLLGSEAKRLKVKILVDFDHTKTLVKANRNRMLQVFFHQFQQSLAALAEKRSKQTDFEGFLRVGLKPGFENVEVQIEDNGDAIKHQYEIQSSVAFTVSKMILEEHEAQFYFTKQENNNTQRIIFSIPAGIA
jgi:nitrogen-specific signal transduction histidine kinase